MPFQGYMRFPTIYKNSIVFVAEDDLWLVESTGGRAERLSAGVAEFSNPHFSPDGKMLAFSGEAEGIGEVYLMQSLGDEARRLTFLSARCRVSGWSPTGEAILFTSYANHFDPRAEFLYTISPEGGLPDLLPYGVANALAYGPQGEVVLGRNIGEPAHWKRYRGGRTGQLWCDRQGNGQFQRLLHLEGNLASPCWIGERLYFISDHEGVGNLYSCLSTGQDLRRHTEHNDFYARNLQSDGERIVYHAGGDLYLFDPVTAESRHIEVVLPSTRTQRSRKFVSPTLYLDSYAVHPQGYAVALTTRGKAFSLGNWEGAVLQHGEPDGVRYRLLQWLNDGKRLVAIHDASGQQALLIFQPEDASEPQTFPDLDLGRVLNLKVAPTEDKIALTNHRQELIVVDLETRSARVIDKSLYSSIQGFAWSPDSKWLAYGFALTAQKTAIKLCKLTGEETYFATDPLLHDWSPAFDPEGKYLYFLSERIFNPVPDNLQFEYSFPRGEKPYAIMLQRDLRSPFIAEPKAPGEKEESARKTQNGAKDEQTNEEAPTQDESTPNESEDASEEDKSTDLVIDLEGITERVLPFPVPEGLYRGIYGLKGKALFLSFNLESTPQTSPEGQPPLGKIECYDFENYKVDWSIEGVSSFDVSRDAKTLIYAKVHSLRVLKASEKPKDNSERASRESGWLYLGRVKVSVQPAAEWKQMFNEAWQLQREYFWTEDMSGINWEAIYQQYAPLVERVGSRDELSDLFKELQGELGTSHAYEGAGDYRHHPHYSQGSLGVDWTYDKVEKRYRIARIIKGDTSDPRATSPLTLPGLNVQAGDAVLAINGQHLGPEYTPQAALVSLAQQEVQITLEAAAHKEIRTITVKTLGNESALRYRAWVEVNRALVHKLSDGQVGYIHIPDMQRQGFAEFHRSFLVEYDAPGLLVDVRWNRGGNVSGLLLEKLARKRIGYHFSRWHQPQPYPSTSPWGPMVALTNEHAGSDGDNFSHSFKLMGLGPLIGTRTWGGVIGITGHQSLVDGTRTTQPEFAHWFKDVGWNLENHGTDPDIEVEITPQDYINQRDPQLERAVAECLKQIERYPILRPEPEERPRKSREAYSQVFQLKMDDF